jgi:hypothetical protein
MRKLDERKSLPHVVSDEFLSELRRRDKEISDGKIKCSTHEEVMVKAEKALR